MTAKYYRVRHWHDLYETPETRKLKKMKWVPLTNKQDGDGYTMLLDHEKGPAHFGCWTAVLQLASKCELRGSLLRKLGTTWLPHDADSISRITRMPKSLVIVTIKRCLEIGWLEELAAFPAGPAGNPADAAENPVLQGSGSEVKGREGKGSDGSDQDETDTERIEAKADHPKAVPKEDPTTTTRTAKPTWADRYPDKFKSMLGSFSDATAKPMNVAVYFRVRFQTKRDGDITHEWTRRFHGMTAEEVFLVFANQPEGDVEMPSQFDDAKVRYFVSGAQ